MIDNITELKEELKKINPLYIDADFRDENFEKQIKINNDRLKSESVRILKMHYDNILNRPIKKTILQMRAGGETLSQVGKEIGISRERVRQIELKTCGLIRNTWKHLEKEIIEEYFNENCEFLDSKFENEIGSLVSTKYALRTSKSNIKYCSSLDLIYYGNDKLKNILKEMKKQKTYTSKEMKKYKTLLINSSSTTKTFFETFDVAEYLVSQGFIKYDDIICKRKIHLGEGILRVVDKYFPDGLDITHTLINGEKIYNDSFLKFEELLKEKYNLSSKTQKSLVFRVESVCVVYGIGLFAHPSRVYINNEVMKKILQYVDIKGVVYFSDLYLAFENDFKSCLNITDGYRLHGAITRYFREENPEQLNDYRIMRGKIYSLKNNNKFINLKY